MFVRLLLLFTVVPMLELLLLIHVGGIIGLFPTLLLVAGTGVLGVSIAKLQGFLVINRIKNNLNQGQIPTDNMVQGILILVGGGMLLTPGLITDVLGFSFILPFTRPAIAKLAQKYFKSYIEKNKDSASFQFHYSNYSGNGNQEEKRKSYDDPDIIDGHGEFTGENREDKDNE